MEIIGGIIIAYIVLLVLDILKRRNHKQTRSLEKFTIRTITDVGFICAMGAALWIGVMLYGLISEPELLEKTFFIILSIIWLGVMFWGMIAPMKGVWDILIDGNNVTVIKAFLFKKHWKISDISHCKMKRGGINVYVNGRKRKAFFVDGMTDHFDNFI